MASKARLSVVLFLRSTQIQQKKGDDLASAPGDIDGGWEEVCLARKTKALYALHDAGAKFLLRRLLTETRQLTHSMTSALEVAVDRT